MPFFSVIIPTYNRAALLACALASVREQVFQDFETIVVDDGSQDETASVVQSCGLSIEFIRQANAGPGAARNRGLQRAQGRYIAFLDSDDTWFPWTLQVFHHAIESGEGPAFIAGFGAASAEPTADSANPVGQMVIRRYANMLAACSGRTPPVGGTPSVCVEREALLWSRGFVDQRINGEDTDLWLRLGDRPGFVRIHSPPVFRQRWHSGSVTCQLEPAVAGAWHLWRQERQNMFPGGLRHSRPRRRIICGTMRSVSRECLKHGRAAEAFRLYWASWAWNLSLGNLKYLAGFPLFALQRSRQ